MDNAPLDLVVQFVAQRKFKSSMQTPPISKCVMHSPFQKYTTKAAKMNKFNHAPVVTPKRDHTTSSSDAVYAIKYFLTLGVLCLALNLMFDTSPKSVSMEHYVSVIVYKQHGTPLFNGIVEVFLNLTNTSYTTHHFQSNETVNSQTTIEILGRNLSELNALRVLAQSQTNYRRHCKPYPSSSDVPVHVPIDDLQQMVVVESILTSADSILKELTYLQYNTQDKLMRKSVDALDCQIASFLQQCFLAFLEVNDRSMDDFVDDSTMGFVSGDCLSIADLVLYYVVKGWIQTAVFSASNSNNFSESGTQSALHEEHGSCISLAHIMSKTSGDQNKNALTCGLVPPALVTIINRVDILLGTLPAQEITYEA